MDYGTSEERAARVSHSVVEGVNLARIPSAAWLVNRKPTAEPGSRFAWEGTTAEQSRAGVLRGEGTPELVSEFNAQSTRWKDQIQTMSAALPSRRRLRVYREEGDEPDVGRYLNGDERHWETRERGRMMPTVTLALNFVLSCGNTAKDFAELAVRAAACSWALASTGYAVRIIGMHYVTGLYTGERWRKHKVGWAMLWDIKGERDPFDPGRVLCHGIPGPLRGYGFGRSGKPQDCAWRECWGLEGMETGGYGVCGEPSPDFLKAMAIDALVGKSWVAASDMGELLQTEISKGFETR